MIQNIERKYNREMNNREAQSAIRRIENKLTEPESIHYSAICYRCGVLGYNNKVPMSTSCVPSGEIIQTIKKKRILEYHPPTLMDYQKSENFRSM